VWLLRAAEPGPSALSPADDLKSPQEFNILAAEVNEHIRQGVQVAKPQNRGDYLFGGTFIESRSGADLARTLVRLSEIQTAYQAALQSGGAVLSEFLLDFLR
jgi:flagellin-like hook-associated protein FlgL